MYDRQYPYDAYLVDWNPADHSQSSSLRTLSDGGIQSRFLDPRHPELEPGDAYSLGAKRVKHGTENFNDVYANVKDFTSPVRNLL